MLFNHGRGALGKAVRQRSPRFIASTNLICRTLRAAALRQLSVPTPPIAYGNLRGEWSLVDCDPIWAVLLSPDAAPGLSFVTTAVTGADIATGLTFPNGRGLHVPLTFDDGTTTFTLQAARVRLRLRHRLRMLIETSTPTPTPTLPLPLPLPLTLGEPDRPFRQPARGRARLPLPRSDCGARLRPASVCDRAARGGPSPTRTRTRTRARIRTRTRT